MSTKPVSKKSDELSNLSISSLLGVAQVMPGESVEAYQSGLLATVEELGADTPLQVYLAEKIFQCLWWMRRYETQKRSSIIAAMADELKGYPTSKDERLAIFKLLQASLWDEPPLKKRIESSGHTPESLLEHAMSSVQDDIQKLEQLIALRVKTLIQLQQSYEALVNRSVLQERLKLQNDLLKRDLQAIDLPVVESTSPTDDKRQAKSLK
jgi:hypothetical protein